MPGQASCRAGVLAAVGPRRRRLYCPALPLQSLHINYTTQRGGARGQQGWRERREQSEGEGWGTHGECAKPTARECPGECRVVAEGQRQGIWDRGAAYRMCTWGAQRSAAADAELETWLAA